MKSRDGNYSASRTKRGTYRVRFYCEENKRQEKWVKTKTEQDALIRAIKKQDDLDYWYPTQDPETKKYSTGSFDVLAQDWLTHAECVREISESCMINYRGHLRNHISPVLGQILLSDLDLKSVEKLATVLKKTKPKTRSYKSVRNNRVDEEFFEDDEFLSTAYRREILTVACMVTKYGFERGYMATNPFEKFQLPECPEQPYDFWRLEEENKFLQWLEDGGVFYKRVAKAGSVKRGKPEYIDRIFRMRPGKADELYDVVLFALRSGMRKGEIGALRPCDINFASNVVVVRRSWSEKEGRMKNTTKSKTFRRIELHADMKSIIEKRMRHCKTDQDLLFNVRTWAIKNFSKYCVKAGVREIHFHSLRHTALTNMANGYGAKKALSLPEVQQIAGHSEITTTQRYIHTHGIENTVSMQYTRAERKAMEAQPSRVVEADGRRLTVVEGGSSI